MQRRDIFKEALQARIALASPETIPTPEAQQKFDPQEPAPQAHNG